MTNRSGWAYGERIPAGSEWLTILGSHYEWPQLRTTREDAQGALEASPQYTNPHLSLEVAHVTEVGRDLYRITVSPEPCGLDECDCDAV